jgi:cytochrome c oxidase subunit 2
VGMKWALLFGVTMLACAGLFLIAPFCGWWLPEGVSSHAGAVDNLFYLILWVTAFFFILTEAILVYFMARYAGEPGQKPAPTEIAWYLKPITRVLDNQHKIEMAWTIVPAAILLLIGFGQISTWAEVKYRSRQEDTFTTTIDGKSVKQTPVQIELSARQFEWRFRYPSSKRFQEWLEKPDDEAVKKDMKSFAQVPQKDDVHVVNELHFWNENPVLVHVSTRDVLHSFNLPQFRVKQDTLPGKQIPVWFRPIKANLDAENKLIKGRDWEIPCAELCGWGHGRMIGRVFVHENRETFFQWLTQVEKSQNATSVPTTVASAP